MGSEPLIQKLFALERAVGKVDNNRLRAMIVDAEEAALAMDREILAGLHAREAGLPAMTNASLARDLATRGGSAAAPGAGPALSIRDARTHRRTA
ncbi:MAG TPA: hypothetical protein VGG42_15930 [Acidobacteriaceae bacterium]